jgi:hypothetical protein
MAERKALSRLGRALRAAVVVLAVALAVDRLALYSWSYSVLSFYRGLGAAWSNPAALPLEKVRAPWIALNESPRGGYELDLALGGSWPSPQRVQLQSNGQLSLFFAPPRIAWLAHCFPRLGYGYEFTYFTGGPNDTRSPAMHLYRSTRGARTEVAPGSVWPPLA